MGDMRHRTSRRMYICYSKQNDNYELGTGFFVHKKSISAFRRVEFVSDPCHT
jgi:hypothetical protein